MKYLDLLAADTLADLKTGRSFKDGQLALLRGSTTSGDGAQGFFQYDEDSLATADDSFIVAPLDANGDAVTRGRWVRVGSTPLGAGSGFPLAAAPASGSVAVSHKPLGNMILTTFTLTAARVSVTDAAGSGSSGSLKLADFPEGSIACFASRMNFTAFAEGAALTGAAGDAAFIIALGSVAADAGDGALTSTEINISGAATGTITLAGGTGTGTKHTATPAIIDGTGTQVPIYLNWSGSAATIDANSTIDITGTISILWAWIGDD
jgi:hypothetical protein